MKTPTTTTRYQALYEDPTLGWMPTNLGIFDSADEAKESASHWLEGYRTRGQGEPRMAIQPLEPRPLPEGAKLI
jgi:hypothetical protein